MELMNNINCGPIVQNDLIVKNPFQKGVVARHDGFALITALVFVLLFLIIGQGALMMSYLGYYTLSSDNNYQRANWAADYALNHAILNQPTCSSSTTNCPSLSNNATCSYVGITDSGNKYCYIRGTGQYLNASVVKTVIVPRSRSGNWGSLVTRSATINLGGSADISNCDTTCPAGGPAIIYQTSLSGSYSPHTSTPANCPNNPKGTYGNPPTSQNASLPSDLTNSFFGTSTDWSHLQTNLGTQYGVDVSGLTAGSIPASCQVIWPATACGGKKQPSCPTVPPGGCSGNAIYISASGLTATLGNISGVTIVSNGTINLGGTVSNCNVFADNIINPGSDMSGGGVFYSQADTTLSMGSNQVLGTQAQPLLLIQGGNFTASGNGGPDLFGMVFTKGTNVSISGNGNLKIHGTMIHDNANATFDTSSGNLGLHYDYTTLTNLSANLSGFTNSPTCVNTANSIILTKQTAY